MVKLEMFYMMNVFLHLKTFNDVRTFIQVSKKCLSVTDSIHVNPWFSNADDIYKYDQHFHPTTLNVNSIKYKYIVTSEFARNYVITNSEVFSNRLGQSFKVLSGTLIEMYLNIFDFVRVLQNLQELTINIKLLPELYTKFCDATSYTLFTLKFPRKLFVLTNSIITKNNSNNNLDIVNNIKKRFDTKIYFLYTKKYINDKDDLRDMGKIYTASNTLIKSHNIDYIIPMNSYKISTLFDQTTEDDIQKMNDFITQVMPSKIKIYCSEFITVFDISNLNLENIDCVKFDAKSSQHIDYVCSNEQILPERIECKDCTLTSKRPIFNVKEVELSQHWNVVVDNKNDENNNSINFLKNVKEFLFPNVERVVIKKGNSNEFDFSQLKSLKSFEANGCKQCEFILPHINGENCGFINNTKMNIVMYTVSPQRYKVESCYNLNFTFLQRKSLNEDHKKNKNVRCSLDILNCRKVVLINTKYNNITITNSSVAFLPNTVINKLETVHSYSINKNVIHVKKLSIDNNNDNSNTFIFDDKTVESLSLGNYKNLKMSVELPVCKILIISMCQNCDLNFENSPFVSIQVCQSKNVKVCGEFKALSAAQIIISPNCELFSTNEETKNRLNAIKVYSDVVFTSNKLKPLIGIPLEPKFNVLQSEKFVGVTDFSQFMDVLNCERITLLRCTNVDDNPFAVTTDNLVIKNCRLGIIVLKKENMECLNIANSFVEFVSDPKQFGIKVKRGRICNSNVRYNKLIFNSMELVKMNNGSNGDIMSNSISVTECTNIELKSLQTFNAEMTVKRCRNLTIYLCGETKVEQIECYNTKIIRLRFCEVSLHNDKLSLWEEMQMEYNLKQ
ncbi:hypothetical protein EIN_300140 [Entamoeba invadens IP1]|uniref:Uncharacterized protein n=1 Tax=Entamoeba invadens IP1 TaxID=370355 RepID=A0A0A1U6K5_ENTIV|nr:hypothetical protein EIN_300140 [Entamoeba invadens IP1]ELP89945.1 hypothetical protein EIN_300140 [Entamoeba invadens IP1]|eukprot:XP_004256716.1 hypothetical protein EIN_300140 [Entamoeba invadens IP1]